MSNGRLLDFPGSGSPNPHLQNLANDEPPRSVQLVKFCYPNPDDYNTNPALSTALAAVGELEEGSDLGQTGSPQPSHTAL